MLSSLAGRIVLGALFLLQGGPQIPAPRGMVNDFANVLPAASVARMERVVQDVRAKSNGEIAVVTLPDLQGRDPAEIALRIGREWKVGSMAAIGDRSRNAGVVILLVPKETSSDGRGYCRVETGQGAEGFITDATSAAICRQATPAFQQRDYGTGIEIVTLLVAQRYATEFGFTLDTTLEAPPVRTPARTSRGTGGISPLFLLIVLFIVLSMLGGGRRGRRGCGGCLPIFLPMPGFGGGFSGGRGGWGGGGFGGGGGGGFGGFGGGGGFSGGGGGSSW